MLRRKFHALKKELLSDLLIMGNQSTSAVDKSIKSLLNKDLALADAVIMEDDIIDDMYKKIEEKAITIMARQCPVAIDLRFLLSVIIVTLHLERIGDLASNIASRTKNLIEAGSYFKNEEIFDIISQMNFECTKLLNQALQAFAGKDNKTGENLHRLDDVVDVLNKQLLREVTKHCDKESFEWLLDIVLISRWLERVADQSVDIGDLTRFLVSGRLL